MSATIGELTGRMRDYERRLYDLGSLVHDKPSPQRRAALERIAVRYDNLAQRLYKLGISPGEL